MSNDSGNRYEALERIFHEPSRMSIMSALCAADGGLSFNQLRETCALTDGNLNRHLKTLQEAGAVTIRKTFVAEKPRTTVYLAKEGLERFQQYLEALADVLHAARRALPAEDRRRARAVPFGRTAEA